jgi:IS605 OrfB family transposase
LRKLWDENIFPLTNTNNTKQLPFKLHKSAYCAAIALFRNWRANDENTQKEYQALKEDTQKIVDHANQFPTQENLYQEWKQQAEQDPKFKANAKFLARWQKTRQKLIKGQAPNQTPYNLLQDQYQDLWLNLQEIDFIALFTERDEAVRYLNEDAKQNASVPTPHTHNLPQDAHFGENYLGFSIKQTNSKLYATLELLDHRNITQLKSHTLELLPSRYFIDLEIQPIKGTKNFQFQYKTGNLRQTPTTAILKEPYLRFNNQLLRTIDPTNFANGYLGQVYLSLPLNVQTKFNDPLYENYKTDKKGNQALDFKPLKNTITYFNTAANDKKADQYLPDIKVGLKAISVDLNINPTLALTTYQLKDNHTATKDDYQVPNLGQATKIEEIKIGTIHSQEFVDQIKNLDDKIYAAKKLIYLYKDLQKNQDEDLKPYDKAFKLAGINPTSQPYDLLNELNSTIGNIARHFRNLRTYTHRHTGVSADSIKYIMVYKKYISLMKSWRYKDQEPLQPGLRRDPRHFSRHLRTLRNIKKDQIKKIAAAIAHYALYQQAHVVLIEDLENFKFSLARTKQENQLLEVWSAREIKNYLVDFLTPHGIALQLIDPRDSSQIDAQTGEYGFRDENEKEILYVQREGNVTTVDSDLNAAQNLQRRFWTRYQDANSIWMRTVVKDGIEPRSLYVPDQEGKRFKAAMTRLGYNTFVLKLGKNLVGELEEVTAKKLKEYASHAQGTNRRPFYRHYDEWLPWKQHQLLRKELKESWTSQQQQPNDDKSHLTLWQTPTSSNITPQEMLDSA